MKSDDDGHDLPGWATISPPPGGLERLHHALRQAPPTQPPTWAMGLSGAMVAVALVATLSLIAGARQQSDSVRRIVTQAQAYQQAGALTLVAGDEDAAVRVYVAVSRPIPQDR